MEEFRPRQRSSMRSPIGGGLSVGRLRQSSSSMSNLSGPSGKSGSKHHGKQLGPLPLLLATVATGTGLALMSGKFALLDDIDGDGNNRFNLDDLATGVGGSMDSSMTSKLCAVPISTASHWFVCFLVLIYIAMFVVGRRTNRRVACSWLASNLTSLQHQFFAVGVKCRKYDSVTPKIVMAPFSSGLLKSDGARCFRFYATGRKHCQSMMVELDLKPRQDLLCWAYSFVAPVSWEDVMLVDVPMEDTSMHPFVFSIVRDVDLLFISKTMFDVAFFTRHVPLEMLPRNLCCLTDCTELVPKLLTQKVIRLLFELKDYVQLVHLSDQNTHSGFGPNNVFQKALRFRFTLPGKNRPPKDTQRLMDLVYEFVDLVGTAMLSPAALEQAKQTRKKAIFN